MGAATFAIFKGCAGTVNLFLRNSGPELSRRGIPVYAPCEHRAECGTHFLDVAGRKHKKDAPPAEPSSTFQRFEIHDFLKFLMGT